MECFNSLLLKLREVHEREVEGWQMKIQELSNKKGCDTKRMEDLFTKNQQMKEQQRLLTENIKTLENRLRAGLCDRCTVTQEVAKRRQQEFEASQIQSLHNLSLLAGEMNNQKKENKRLREELRSLRAALDRGQSDSSTEVKAHSSPDLSPPSGPVARGHTATSRSGNQPEDGDVVVKTEADQRSEEAQHRQLRWINRNHYDSYKPLSWKTEPSIPRAGERRSQSVEGLDQRPSLPPQALLLKNFPTLTGGEGRPSRHVLHAPVPCRPQPIQTCPATLPWHLSESSDWVSPPAPGSSLVVQPSQRPNPPRYPNLIPTSHHASPRRQGFSLTRHSTPQPLANEPTVVVQLRSMSDTVNSQTMPLEKKQILPPKTERVFAEQRGTCDGPLDLSDRGKSKTNQTPRECSPIALQGEDRGQRSPDKDGKANQSAHGPVSSSPPVLPPRSSSTPPGKQQDKESAHNHNNKVFEEDDQKEELNGKTDQSNEKKVPVLTISLRPVVVLESLNSALQESLTSKSKSSSAATQQGSSSDEREDEGSVSERESSQGCKRRRASAGTETDRDSETDNTQKEKKIKITVRTEERSPR
ncbi:hypothetical protein CesoFtcFv8_008105 [Champsocephalus esox]|uniref:DNA endonuclease Ctp1 N-terminal domain-containing protein n=1 Tax=Champsocephalus esox TaxID=159716 RepID=A0AAN8CFE7_9TELE|nr:hypothetical protein CesoFtcFv8_008105 [Champsocephalus esox]